MATALVGAGLLVVGTERAGERLLGERSWMQTLRRTLPRLMAFAVLGVGLVLTMNALASIGSD
jgi:hypothetical protein